MEHYPVLIGFTTRSWKEECFKNHEIAFRYLRLLVPSFPSANCMDEGVDISFLNRVTI
jgi:hypothetical protein